jgi:hypothetical protein
MNKNKSELLRFLFATMALSPKMKENHRESPSEEARQHQPHSSQRNEPRQAEGIGVIEVGVRDGEHSKEHRRERNECGAASLHRLDCIEEKQYFNLNASRSRQDARRRAAENRGHHPSMGF